MDVAPAPPNSTARAPIVARAIAALRPAEMVLVGYVGWALFHMALAGRFKVRFGFLPGPDLLLVLLSVVTVRLFVHYTKAPLPPDRKRLHLALAPALLALGAAGLAFVGLDRPSDYGDPDQASTWLLFAREEAARIGLALALPAFAWLVIARSIGRGPLAEGLSPWRLAREALVTIGSASRDWLALVLTIYAYSSTETSGPLFADADDTLKLVDRALFFGHDPNVLAERLISPALSEWMAGCYVFYVLLFPIALGVVYAFDEARFRWFAFAVALTLALGYVGYALVPAQGPVFVTHFDVSLDLYYLRPVKEQLMDRPRVPRDCFPSLHTAASLTLLRGLWKSSPKLGWALAPIVFSIPLACIYLRYHYVTDVLAGIALFGLVALVTDALARRETVRRAAAAPSVGETG